MEAIHSRRGSLTAGAWITRLKSPRAIIRRKLASDGAGIAPLKPPIGKTSRPES